jgi:hypothetical protein
MIFHDNQLRRKTMANLLFLPFELTYDSTQTNPVFNGKNSLRNPWLKINQNRR